MKTKIKIRNHKKSKHNQHKKKLIKMDEIDINKIHKQIKSKTTQCGITISWRRTENNFLSIRVKNINKKMIMNVIIMKRKSKMRIRK